MRNINCNISLQVFGDVSLDGIFCDPQQHRILSENMSWLDHDLGYSDIRLLNWESPLWGNGSVNNLKFPRLCTTHDAALAMLTLKFNVAALANNHVYDNGIKGYHNTKEFFHANNIKFLGAGETQDEACQPLVLEKNEISVCVLNFVDDETNPKLPEKCPLSINLYEIDKVCTIVREKKKKYDHVIVYLHWGEEENVRIPNPKQRVDARKLIDNGASVVIGSHVHCLQGYEEYKNGLICYSLGNFLFGPQLVVPGKIVANRTADNKKVGVLILNFAKKDFSFLWKYYRQEKNGITLQSDKQEEIALFHKKLCDRISCTDTKLRRRYKVEKLLMPVRCFLDKNGGFLKAIFSLRIKQLKLAKKILRK